MDSSITVGGYVKTSSSSGSFSTASTSYVDVTNLSVTIKTKGRPVYLALIHDGTANLGYFAANQNVSGSTVTSQAQVKIKRGSTDIYESILVTSQPTNSSTVSVVVPLGSVAHVDVVAAGTYTYKVQVKSVYTTNNAEVIHAKLIAFEI